MKKILITGSNGLLGHKLIDLLSIIDHVEIIGSGLGANRYKNTDLKNFTYHTLDITNAEQVQLIFNLVKPTHIIHTAAMTNVDACELNEEMCFLQNVVGTQNLITGANQLAVRPHFTLLSTDFIFDGAKGPYREIDLPNPLSIYATSKLEAEKIVETSNLNYAIARTVLVYGYTNTLSRNNIVLWVKESLEAGKEINVVTDQFRTPTLAEDLAQGCIAIAFKNAQGIFNISGKDFMHINDLAHRVARFWNLDESLIKVSNSSAIKQPAMRPPITGFVLDKAFDVLQYQPHTFEQGLAIIDKQLKENKKP